MNSLMLDLSKTKLEKHSVTIAGHRTSISLEVGFWIHFKRIAEEQNISLNEIIRQLDEARTGSLSGAIRVYVLENLEHTIQQNQTDD